MRQKLGILIAFAALAAAVMGIPTGAQATHCDSQVVVFGWIAGQTAVNEGAAVCILDPQDHVVDTRIINPGSTLLSVRYLGGAENEVAVINGFGYENLTLPLIKNTDATGTLITWNTETFEIDPTALDFVTVQILDADGLPIDDGTGNTCFHTLGATCADFTPNVP